MDHGEQNYRLFLKGDEAGLVQIICDYKDGLMLYLNTFVSDLSVAEELTEDTFVKLVLKKPRFSARSSFKTWLYAIGRNLAMDHLRRRQKAPLTEPEYPLIADQSCLEASYIHREDKLAVHAVIKKLKPEYRQVLWLIYFEGFSCAEVGKIMGKSTHNAETLVHRARRALKTKLIEEGFEYENF